MKESHNILAKSSKVNVKMSRKLEYYFSLFLFPTLAVRMLLGYELFQHGSGGQKRQHIFVGGLRLYVACCTCIIRSIMQVPVIDFNIQSARIEMK